MSRDPRYEMMLPLPKRKVFTAALAMLLFFVLAIGLACLAFAYNFYSEAVKELPNASEIYQVQLKLPSVVLSEDNVVIGEIFSEKRYPIKIEEMGSLIPLAFVSAEDAGFYQHSGIDYNGIMRAAIRFVFGTGAKQGGSTITQQLAKNLLLSRERTVSRKIKDIVLAREIEKILSKNEILEMYLNTIFLGNNSYGVEAAARNYFRRSASELSLAQAAMIAGLAPAPSAYAPTTNYKAAKIRQRYVLRQMVHLGKISEDDAKAAYDEQLQVYRAESPNTTAAPYFMADVRKITQSLIGDEALTSGGYRIYTSVDAQLQSVANQLVPSYLSQFESQKGFKGPIGRHGEGFQERLSEILQDGAPDITSTMNAIVTDLIPAKDVALIVTEAGPGMLLAEDHLWALEAGKIKESSVLDFAHILAIGDEVRVRIKQRKAPARIKENLEEFSSLGKFLKLFPREPLHKGIRFYELVDVEQVEAAIILMDAHSGDVKVMVGGSSFEQSQFNRATQARRQMGSSIKPLYYTMSFDRGFGLASKLDSPPIVIGDWKPENYSKDFLSQKTLRTSLIRSYNIPSIQLFQAIGAADVTAFLGRFGLDAPSGDLSVALGSVGATVLEVAQAYTPFLNHGRLLEAKLITRIEDRNGQVIYDGSERALLPAPLRVFDEQESSGGTASRAENKADDKAQKSGFSLEQGANASNESPEPAHPGGPEVFSPAAAYLGYAGLRDVVRFGTGTKARIEGVDVAGKTGTTNGYTDSWFVGMIPGYVCAVWIGFDDAGKSLGSDGTGGQMAAPLWRQLMARAAQVLPLKGVEIPSGVKLTRIDPESGQPAENEQDGIEIPVMEGFEPGSESLRHALGLHGVDSPSDENNASENRSPALENQETTRTLRSLF